jgi:3-phosphoinositide dependent protein kinase-1
MEERFSQAANFERSLSEAEDPSRGTFVGTPLYVSPEMLDANLSGPSNDIWSLGCIIYQCLTGDVMFKAQHETQIFEMIMERKLSFPKYMDVEAIDLIDKLMHKNPAQRLGVGTDNKNDYESLKKHKFFKGINFKKIEETHPPIPAYFKKKIN